jgi:hypothetical protein
MALSITGQFDIEGQWEEYLSTLEQMGLPLVLETYQKAYDTFKANQ